MPRELATFRYFPTTKNYSHFLYRTTVQTLCIHELCSRTTPNFSTTLLVPTPLLCLHIPLHHSRAAQERGDQVKNLVSGIFDTIKHYQILPKIIEIGCFGMSPALFCFKYQKALLKRLFLDDSFDPIKTPKKLL